MFGFLNVIISSVILYCRIGSFAVCNTLLSFLISKHYLVKIKIQNIKNLNQNKTKSTVQKTMHTGARFVWTQEENRLFVRRYSSPSHHSPVKHVAALDMARVSTPPLTAACSLEDINYNNARPTLLPVATNLLYSYFTSFYFLFWNKEGEVQWSQANFRRTTFSTKIKVFSDSWRLIDTCLWPVQN